MEIKIPYVPHPKQREFHESPCNEILFGGAAGPGKSMAIRHELMMWCLRVPKLQAYLFRRTYPELEKNHVIPSLAQFPRDAFTYNEGKKRWTCINGSMLHLCHCQRENDVFDYQGAEIHVLGIDELTSFTEFQYTYLRGRVRCTLDVPEQWKHKIPGIMCASNPLGIGHEFVKRVFVDYCGGKKGGMRRAPAKDGGMLRQYIPAVMTDNPTLSKEDPGYSARVESMPEPYRTAYKDADWDVVFGAMFAFNQRDHVEKPMPVPENAPLLFTFDDGFGAPFSMGWWWVDADGCLHRFREFYGENPNEPNQGLRWSYAEMAQKVIEIEAAEGISEITPDGKLRAKRSITRLCDPTCFNKNPSRYQGGQGPSCSEEFARFNIFLSPGDPRRKIKIRQFHERLAVKRDAAGNVTAGPRMKVYDTCEAFIRTIPLLQPDPHDAEDLDTRGPDHVYDEACHAVMSRASFEKGDAAALRTQGLVRVVTGRFAKRDEA